MQWNQLEILIAMQTIQEKIIPAITTIIQILLAFLPPPRRVVLFPLKLLFTKCKILNNPSFRDNKFKQKILHIILRIEVVLKIIAISTVRVNHIRLCNCRIFSRQRSLSNCHCNRKMIKIYFFLIILLIHERERDKSLCLESHRLHDC